MSADSEIRDGDIVTVRQFSQQNPAWTEAGLRWLRFTADQNGLAEAGAFIEQGKRVLIDKPRFFAWVRGGQKERMCHEKS